MIAFGIKVISERIFKPSTGRNKMLKEEEEVIFFPEETTVPSLSKIKRLVARVSKSEMSLDLCLYLITLKPLADAIITLKQTGVKVRCVLAIFLLLS